MRVLGQRIIRGTLSAGVLARPRVWSLEGWHRSCTTTIHGGIASVGSRPRDHRLHQRAATAEHDRTDDVDELKEVASAGVRGGGIGAGPWYFATEGS